MEPLSSRLRHSPPSPLRSHQADTWFTCFHSPLAHLALIDAVHTCMKRAYGHWKGAGSCHGGGDDLHWSPLAASFAILLPRLFAHIKLPPASPPFVLPMLVPLGAQLVQDPLSTFSTYYDLSRPMCAHRGDTRRHSAQRQVPQLQKLVILYSSPKWYKPIHT